MPPRAGDALVFFSFSDTGEVESAALHGGRPTSAVKWIANQVCASDIIYAYLVILLCVYIPCVSTLDRHTHCVSPTAPPAPPVPPPPPPPSPSGCA